MKIYVVDQMMGSGKTSAAINYINETQQKKFIYVTPFLSEVERIKEKCSSKDFYSPEGDIKIRALKKLLNQGRNIVTTHALFRLFDDEIITLCKSQSYVLIMDEVTNVIENFSLTSSDRKMLFNNYVYVGEKQIVKWRDDAKNYEGRFEDIKRMAKMECLGCYGDNTVLWLMPVKIFNAFEESYILTFMFDGQLQKYYYDYHGLKYTYLNVDETFHFTDKGKGNNYDPSKYSKLINICNSSKLNYIGQDRYSLTKSWYEKNQNGALMVRLTLNIKNYFKNVSKTRTKNNMWTTFNSYKNILKGGGYTKGFIPCNARSTNIYSNRTSVAYAVNRYMNPYIKQFFQTNGIVVDEDKFALSEMLQFIWRSAIRNGEPITVYIPSLRMRMLLYDWLGLDKFNDLCYANNGSISIHHSIKMKGDTVNEG